MLARTLDFGEGGLGGLTSTGERNEWPVRMLGPEGGWIVRSHIG